MDVAKAIRERRSVRAYQDKDIPSEVLEEILHAARLAPSANNRQPWKFIVIRERRKREDLARAAKEQQFVAEAPVIVAAVALEPERISTSGMSKCAIDLAIAVDHMSLAAVEKGVGSCWIGAFYQEEVKRILGVPEEYKVGMLLTLGYPRNQAGFKDRKELSEIICYEKWC